MQNHLAAASKNANYQLSGDGYKIRAEFDGTFGEWILTGGASKDCVLATKPVALDSLLTAIKNQRQQADAFFARLQGK